MRQRLSLARAFLGRPRLFVLDEPFNALDPDAGVEVRRLVAERRARDGAAFLVSSHDLLEMERLADRVAILRAGRVVRDEPLASLVRSAGAHYRLDVGDAARAREVLGALATPSSEVEGALDVRAGREGVPALVKRLVEAGVAIHEVREVVPTLEDVFRAIAAEEGSGAPAAESARPHAAPAREAVRS
jgi:ABC-2 type transport system ATP-binding protein